MSRVEFAGALALVTGAAGGIGAAVAARLAEGGADLLLTDRDAATLAEQARALRGLGVRVETRPLDLRDAAAIETFLAGMPAEFGVPTLLVNVAGVLCMGDATTLEDEAWEESFAINTTAVFRLSRACARLMKPRRQGAIVTVGSNAAHAPRLGMAAYAASKAATAHFMRCLALELAPHGIRCNTVSPGSTDTAMQRAFAASPEQVRAVLEGDAGRFRLGIPLARIASPADIAEAVCFLASPRARHVTMQDLVVDGGATLGA